MTSIKATITSKNQITLPISLVRKYKLDKNRTITFTDKGGTIELHPQPSLDERLAALEKKLPTFQGTQTDEELQQAIRGSFGRKHL